jgi:hypothetical protein
MRHRTSSVSAVTAPGVRTTQTETVYARRFLGGLLFGPFWFLWPKTMGGRVKRVSTTSGGVTRATTISGIKAHTSSSPSRPAPTSTEPPTSRQPSPGDLTAGSRLAGWHEDPTGRHAQRFWDGSKWTDFVEEATTGAPGTHLVDSPAAPGLQPNAQRPTDTVEPIQPTEQPSSRSAATSTPLGGQQGSPSQPAAWFGDPTGRHEYRYWDGTRWSEHVGDGGATSADPL